MLKGFFDRIFLLIIAVALVFLSDVPDMMAVAATLIMFISFSLGEFFEDKRGEIPVEILNGIIALVFDGGMPIIFLLTYEAVTGVIKKKYASLWIFIITFVVYDIIILLGRECYYYEAVKEQPWIGGIFIFGIVLSVHMAFGTVRMNKLEREKLKLRDDKEEIIRLENARYLLMVQNQDAEIQMATLSERNRIAREIHDNVGHLLSRCILQLGAIAMVHKNETVSEELKPVQDGLNESMNSIRNSVHNLHNESLDLKKSLENLIEANSDFQTDFEYDVENELPMKVKYCIIAVITESYHNAVKHSNGNKVDLIIREHPGFCQVVFSDNGTNAKLKENGIGLHNMEERVRELKGTISFSTDNGFKIFISIPKEI